MIIQHIPNGIGHSGGSFTAQKTIRTHKIGFEL